MGHQWGRTRNLSGAVAGAATDVEKNTGDDTSLLGFVGFSLIFFLGPYFFLDLDTVVFSFVLDNYCLTMD